MGCGCGKPNRNMLPRRNVVGPTPTSSTNLQPSSNQTVVPVNVQRAAALGQIPAQNNPNYLTPQRLRIEKLRREAIQQALGKQFL